MGNETLLPKNIRQIGEVQGRQKICLEDYVMTYIKKKEKKEDENFLAIFLGERKTAEDAEYVFIRGILEVPGEERLQQILEKEKQEARQAQKDLSREEAGLCPEERSGKEKEKSEEERSGKEKEKTGENKSGKEKEKTEENESGKEKEKTKENKSGKEKTKENESGKEKNETGESGENGECRQEPGDGGRENGRAESKPQDPGIRTEEEPLWSWLRREQEMHFPGMEIQGCCVVGTYPPKRMEALSAHFPESGRLLYHLQDQEERLYWLQDGKYEGIRGYFVFYEQNRRMQEYLEEVFGEESVEKESLPDKAIRSFREKIKGKSEEQGRSFLRLASSFFVVTVLIIGAVVVNRVEDLKEAQMAADSFAATATEGEASGESVSVQETAGEKSAANETNADGAESTADEKNAASEKSAAGETGLAGADAFWTEDAGGLEAVSANPADPADEGTEASESEGEASDRLQEALESVSAGAETAAPEGEQTESQADSGEEGQASAQADAKTASAAVARQTQATYTIREGDTLADICSRYYGSLNRLEDLCEANNISDADLILPGQKLVLPQ